MFSGTHTIVFFLLISHFLSIFHPILSSFPILWTISVGGPGHVEELFTVVTQRLHASAVLTTLEETGAGGSPLRTQT